MLNVQIARESYKLAIKQKTLRMLATGHFRESLVITALLPATWINF